MSVKPRPQDEPSEILGTRIDHAQAILIALMNTFQDDLSETNMPAAYLWQALDAASDALKEAKEAMSQMEARRRLSAA